MEILWLNLPYLLKGALVTLALSASCIALSNLLGLVLGVLLFMGPRWVRGLITVYIFVFRGIPELVLMFLAYFGLSYIGVNVSSVVAVSGALILYAAAYVTDYFRGALRTVDAGQIAAGRSIGLRWWQLLWHIRLPQAFSLAIPALINTAIITVKGTSYVSVVGVWELTFASVEVVQRTFAAFQIFSGVMLIYFAICYPLGVLSRILEKKFKFSLS
ncbi:MAG: amino acid ABC transporter permease [Candidimonas sp.]|nr:MAG: amino acid ABC transporter permease [Candidimonas sp.]